MTKKKRPFCLLSACPLYSVCVSVSFLGLTVALQLTGHLTFKCWMADGLFDVAQDGRRALQQSAHDTNAPTRSGSSHSNADLVSPPRVSASALNIPGSSLMSAPHAFSKVPWSSKDHFSGGPWFQPKPGLPLSLLPGSDLVTSSAKEAVLGATTICTNKSTAGPSY